MPQPAEENPYQSPSEAADSAVLRETALRRASLAWQFPLIGVLLFVAMNFVSWFPLATSLYFLLLLAMLGCWVGGLVMTVYAIVTMRRYSGMLRHGLQGMFCNAMLTGVILLGLVGYGYLADESTSSATSPTATPATSRP